MNQFKRITLGTLLGAVAAGASWRAFAQGGRHGGGWGSGPIDPAAMNERIEHFVKHLAVEVDATPKQQQKLAAIAKDAAKELVPLRERMHETRKQAIALLSASNIDRAAIEKLRAAQLAQAETASRRLTQALADAAEVLTPEQRKKLAEHVGRGHGRWAHG